MHPLQSALPAHSIIRRVFRKPGIVALLFALSVHVAAGAVDSGGTILFSDTFNVADSANINATANRASRQTGVVAPVNYDVVTLFAAGADRSAVKDSAAITQGALALTDSRMPGKGPASLALGKLFPDAAGPFLISATLRPGKAAWTAIKWGPQRNGNWPDLSPGIAVNITPGGTWTVWANGDGKTKNVIGHGQVARATSYPVAIAFAGLPGARRLTVSIGDLIVVPETPVAYSGTGHNLIFQALGGKDSGTSHIDDVVVERLIPGGGNDPAAAVDTGVGLWIEAEDTTDTNFHSGKVVNVDRAGPSGGMFLRLFASPSNPKHPAPPYHARYQVSVPVAGAYTLWVASTPNNTSWASPLNWRVNDGEPVSLKGRGWTGASWGKPSDRAAGWVFGWTQAGTVELAAGQHEIELGVTEPRGSSSHYVASVDALLLTNSKSFLPVGSRPRYSPQPSWEERMKTTTEREFANALNRRLYYELVVKSNEQIGEEVSAKVLAKIAARPLPDAKDRATDTTEFGLHGMERPFVSVRHNGDDPAVAQAYNLIARAGVDSLRTAESCWHRLATESQKQDTTKLHLDFLDLDFQMKHSWKYGMTHLFTVGYPPAALTVGKHHLSACDPRHHALYSDYLDTVFARYADQGLRWIEVGNEVDAPSTWWRKSTPAQYVEETRLVHASARRHAPDARIVAFGATYSRDEEHGGEEGGRRFVTRSFDLGIDQYADAYSLHHITQLKTKDFPAYFRRELARTGDPGSLKKPLLNTEQNGGSYPYDGIKAFARCFFLHDIPRVDYFIARDFYENGSLLTWGLFDIDWRPKLRLLAYAFSVDAMRGRELVGVARPAPGVEAYVLKRRDSYAGAAGDPIADTSYSIVLWKTDREANEWTDASRVEPVEVGAGLKGVKAAVDWKLDEVAFDPGLPAFFVGDAPLAIYTEQVPDWPLLTREAYLETVDAGQTEAPLPTSH